MRFIESCCNEMLQSSLILTSALMKMNSKTQDKLSFFGDKSTDIFSCCSKKQLCVNTAIPQRLCKYIEIIIWQFSYHTPYQPETPIWAPGPKARGLIWAEGWYGVWYENCQIIIYLSYIFLSYKFAISPMWTIITPFALLKGDMCLKAMLVSHMQNEHIF